MLMFMMKGGLKVVRVVVVGMGRLGVLSMTVVVMMIVTRLPFSHNRLVFILDRFSSFQSSSFSISPGAAHCLFSRESRGDALVGEIQSSHQRIFHLLLLVILGVDGALPPTFDHRHRILG